MPTLDWNKYLEKAAEVNAEGAVLLKNEGVLPLDKNREVAVFGRIQLDYYKSGTGSGGMVNVAKVTGIVDGLLEAGAKLNEEVLNTYRSWVAEHPYDYGKGWGGEPWCQEEMPLSDELAAKAAETSDTALVIIGRTAGEEQDNSCTAGSYLLSEGEKAMLAVVRRHFRKMAVLLNVGNIIDMGFEDEFSPEAVMYLWQGGMTGGTGAARVLLGEVSPSGCLPDTIAYDISDYPSDKNFHDRDRNIYAEDIFVGYRYFDTFAKDRVRYHFGFGLSYTTFEVKPLDRRKTDEGMRYTVSVKNTGKAAGKNVVMLICKYCEVPEDCISLPENVLCGFEKTKTLAPGEVQELVIDMKLRDIAVYDDSGITGHKNCWVLPEQPRFLICAASLGESGLIPIDDLTDDYFFDHDGVIEKLEQAMAPVMEFERMARRGDKLVYEKVPMSAVDEAERRKAHIPEEIPFTGDKGIKLADVARGSSTLDEFVAQLDDDDLNCLVRGEGMCSPRVTPGTAAAFGGVSKHLEELGIPAGCCSDGPSGMRLDVGTKAFSLPNGTLIAATFNKPLITELFAMLGLEMRANHVDCLLGPGMNIHRHPLNGRNFEYFSEDPFLTGSMAAAELKGLHGAGVEGTIKHFCGNNQETNRHFLDAAVSERALREIYLKGFEMAVKEGGGRSVMTTYGKVNDLWTAGNHDLNTEILRKEWGFDGFVMTDWWANINDRGCAPDKDNFAAMVKAQNDVYMVCPDGGSHSDNIKAALADGRLARSELQRSAKNILSFLKDSHAMKRLMGEEEKVEVINKPDESVDEGAADRLFILDGSLELDLSDVKTARGLDYSFTLDTVQQGQYRMEITASSTQSELAQMPVTVFSLGTAWGTFTWNGTGGEPVTMVIKELPIFSRYTIFRLHFGLGGLDMHSIKFTKLCDAKGTGLSVEE
ncbi:glycoside hydrolase family 3 N-terminal domain-containing protein [Ruminococcus sp.]|uniref:glycoside hydrolase family 3 N-terminal domain-containing protein n=1 Tax=Ruminococcus sp. TaxID=41978 RepID=UPI0025DD80FF|nr:glycoside hydrolase family 3 N-terminal domain-containing protein [Ruminococcus sp.]MBQ8966158.1 glycoside hydrolase family 3 C-terminal domain-containing protein [Ruminococcus sp.]